MRSHALGRTSFCQASWWARPAPATSTDRSCPRHAVGSRIIRESRRGHRHRAWWSSGPEHRSDTHRSSARSSSECGSPMLRWRARPRCCGASCWSTDRGGVRAAGSRGATATASSAGSATSRSWGILLSCGSGCRAIGVSTTAVTGRSSRTTAAGWLAPAPRRPDAARRSCCGAWRSIRPPSRRWPASWRNVARQELITRVPAPTRRRAGASRRGSGGRRSGHQGEPPARAGGRPIGTEDPSGRPITHARRAGAQLVGPAAGRGLHPSADRRRAVIPHPERPRPRAPGPVPARGAGARVVRVRGDRSGGRRERDDARDERIRPGDLTRARGLQDRRPPRPHPSPTPRARWRNPCSRPRRWAW